jgi:hypothetical protein
LAADRPWRANQPAVAKIRAEWLEGKPSGAATTELLATVRHASPEEASTKVIELLNRGVAAQSISDALFAAAGELLMRRPGILSLHASTSTNALHFAFQNCANDETRRLLLLQNAAFLTLFRGDGDTLKQVKLDELQAAKTEKGPAPGLDEIFADVSRDRMAAARKVMSYVKENPEPSDFINTARRLIFLKGNNSHDYKYSSAVLEDFHNVSPAWRGPFLAASAFNLRGSGDKDNSLVNRTRAALKT